MTCAHHHPIMKALGWIFQMTCVILSLIVIFAAFKAHAADCLSDQFQAVNTEINHAYTQSQKHMTPEQAMRELGVDAHSGSINCTQSAILKFDALEGCERHLVFGHVADGTAHTILRAFALDKGAWMTLDSRKDGVYTTMRDFTPLGDK